MVEQIKRDRERFTNWGDAPAAVPKEQLLAARAACAKVYAAAIKDYIRLKLDDASEVVEKDRLEFLVGSAILLGKKTPLVSLKHFGVTAQDNEFTSNGTEARSGAPLTLFGKAAPKSVFMTPPPDGTAQVSHNVAGRDSVFRAVVGVPKIEENAQNTSTPLTFEVLGDAKLLWASEPIPKMNLF